MSEAILINISGAMGTNNGRRRRRNSITNAPPEKGNLVNYAESHLAFLNKSSVYRKKEISNNDTDSSSCADEPSTGSNNESSCIIGSSNDDQHESFNATFLIKRRGSLKFCKPKNTPNRSISISLPLDAHRVNNGDNNDDDQEFDDEDHRKYSANSETMIKLLKQECTTLRRESQILLPKAKKSSSSSPAVTTKKTNTLKSLVKQQSCRLRGQRRKGQKPHVSNDHQELRRPHQNRRSSYPAYIETLVKDLDFKQTNKLYRPNNGQSNTSRRRIVHRAAGNTMGRRSSHCY